MRSKNATAPMQGLFTSYHTLLVRNGLESLIEANPRVAVQRGLSSVKSQTLYDRLTDDFACSQYALRKDFRRFLKYAIRWTEAFQSGDSSPNNTANDDDSNRGGGGRRRSCGGGGRGRGGAGRRGGGGGNPDNGSKVNYPEENDLPLCLWEPRSHKGIRHLLKDCTEYPRAKKKNSTRNMQKNLRVKDRPNPNAPKQWPQLRRQQRPNPEQPRKPDDPIIP